VALAQHTVAFFYTAAVACYHFLSWFLTMLVVTVFILQVGVGWLHRRYPVLCQRLAKHPLAHRLHPASRGCNN
jgi:hypothetical protein